MGRQEKSEVLQGTLDLMILQSLDSMGRLHGWGIARRIEQISQDALFLNQDTWAQTGDQVVITPKEGPNKDTRALTLKDGRLSLREKGKDGIELELVFKRK